MTQFSGIWVPLVTPFRDGEVDYASAQNLAAHLADKGVNGLLVCGTTGEGSGLTPVEKTLLIENVLDAVGGRCPLIMGLNGPSTYLVADEVMQFEKTGIDGFLISAPCYVRPGQDGIIAHFRHIAKGTDLPIILYDIPGRTGVNMELETITALCESDQFVAVKECAGISQLWALANDAPCNVLCGEDKLIFTTLAHGGHGAIATSANIHPEFFVALYKLMQQGKFEAARALFNQLVPLIRLMFSEPNPAPVKAALAMQGWIHEELRLPMMPASESCKEQLRKVLAELEFSKSGHLIEGVKSNAA